MPDDLTYFPDVMRDVREERIRQIEKFGQDNPLVTGPDAYRLAILSEEHGEVAREVCEAILGNDVDRADLYKELIQVAAVSSSWAEQMLREVV